ncbi:MAG: hypothetical protein AAGA95_05535 [Pseudomonadota bacterium]
MASPAPGKAAHRSLRLKPAAVWAFLVAGALGASSAPALELTRSELSGLVQLSAVHADPLRSFINSGTGVVRYDDSGVQLQQSVLRLETDFGNAFSSDIVANYYQDGDLHLGLTQAALLWKPVSAGKLRTRARAGFFYPRMSAENVDLGWLSPYTYTQSAINSWIGEELRVLGVEGSVYSPGRSRRSPWSWELTGAIYGGNDPFGTIISWRGFATHDRQSLHHDRLQFAPYPPVIDEITFQGPAWVEPFHEIDNRLGGYAGFHLRYRNQLDLRLYRYDNNANPKAVNQQQLYAWDTRFNSIALRYDPAPGTRVLAQWMGGSSDMGEHLVGIGFDSFYLMLSQRLGEHRVSLRYDFWDVDESDLYARDANSSEGDALTAAWRWNLDKQWQLGFEYHLNVNSAENRVSVGEAIDARQQQALVVLEYRFGK